ncbi:hypothetical protein RYX36_030701, partial [Vicia faba]
LFIFNKNFSSCIVDAFCLVKVEKDVRHVLSDENKFAKSKFYHFVKKKIEEWNEFCLLML